MNYNEEWEDVTSIPCRDGGLEMRDELMKRLDQDDIRLISLYDGDDERVILQEMV